ncbi:hypothetical protein Back11_06770 [Paenibacillus baekrokdamisoli]|uniref:Uncharacterized protein n=1 Tax=Paenibacillus baekrokdamisoli TaxID=1712516 RepID=A0A3G9IM82_9BACL|nr:FecR domain-containing protein [Paenibacillus baekrokdamisoli]MBB3067483.1 hypothetical protein [Paenibacillus baekrokdamisoli]BBH19332.1 hypothetical protein Back11_06770 [Paenibacillus baekrokdamisoli]
MKARSNRLFLLTLCLTLLIGPLSLFAASTHASAEQVMRVAIVKSLKGTVSVLKSGGSKSFKAFNNMSLNEGDQITTGKDGLVELNLASKDADKDTLNIGQNSQVTFTKLKDSSGTKTKMSVWAGSLWIKVKSVSNASDQFEIETPTSIMGVRGTQLFVVVDPITGLTKMVVAAGIVQSNVQSKKDSNAPTGTTGSNTYAMYPSQQITQVLEGNKIDSIVSPIDMNDFIQNTSADIIKAIVKDAESIKKEQDQQIEKLKQSLKDNKAANLANTSFTLDDLTRLAKNLDNLISGIAKAAVDEGKVDKDEMQKIVDEVNKKAGSKIVDISKDLQQDLTNKEKQKLEEAKKLLDKQKELAKEKEKQKQEQLKRLEDAINEQKKQALANKKAKEEALAQAELEYYKKLKENEKKAFNENRKENNLPPIGEDSSSPSNNNPSTPASSASFNFPGFPSGIAAMPAQGPLPVEMSVVLSGFYGTNRIYGYQVEVEYETSKVAFDQVKFAPADYRNQSGIFKVEPAGATVEGADSVDDLRVIAAETKTTVIYTVAKFSGQGIALSDNTTVMKLPFNILNPGSINFHIKSLTAVDEQGNLISTPALQDLTLQVNLNP